MRWVPLPDIQEHLVLPVSADTVREAVTLNIRVHEETGRILAIRDAAFTGGCDDERGWAANLDDVAALEVLAEATGQVEAQTGARFRLGLDLAADRMWDGMTIKVNQVGTVTGARAVNDQARAHGVATVISHRSGETDDVAIAHFGAAWGCSLIKTGVLGGERLAKLNELIRIEEGFGEQPRLAPLPPPLATIEKKPAW